MKLGLLSTVALVALAGCTTTSTDAKSGSGAANPSQPSTPSGSGGGAAGADARMFLPTGEPDNTSAPRIETDAAGNVHAVYPAYAGGGAYYAFCAKDCASQSQVKVVRFDTNGTVANAMIALTADGHPRVLLSAYAKAYWAQCDGDCTDPKAWTTTAILEHGGDREITGEALALDPQGRPRFLMHTYRALLGIGQKPFETMYVLCDAGCNDPKSWRQAHVSNQTWQGSTLRVDAQGRAHAAVVAHVEGKDGAPSDDLAGYFLCESSCEDETHWHGAGLMRSYASETSAVRMEPTISMAMTKAGTPRVLVLGTNDAGKKSIVYFACDSGCGTDEKGHWEGTQLSDHDAIGPGLDLALDDGDHPRFAYTLSYNIVFGRCDDAQCQKAESAWKLTKVEFGADMPPDKIFLWPNCNVAAWFLHGPSLALGPGGQPRVGYQARDISGGLSNPDKTKPACVAGTDMTWSRLALMSHYE